MIAGLRFQFVLLAACLGWISGAARAQPALEIRLASPGEGETFYMAPGGYLTSIPIAGQVISRGQPLQPETIQLTLQLINEAGAVVDAAATLNDAGYFETWATITAADALSPVIEVHETDLCPRCHRHGDFDLPAGVTRLIVHARAEDGRTASATRELRLDRGRLRPLTVQVNGLPPEVTGAKVMATTRLYEWRRRSGFGDVTAAAATVQIETLTFSDLVYEVSLLPLVWEGVRYTTPVETLVVGAATDDEPLAVSLTAQPSLGTLSGRVVAGLSSQGVEASLLAVRLDSGAAYTTQTSAPDGVFALTDLPIAEYLLLARAPGVFQLPQRLTPGSDDLTLHLTAAGADTLRGRVTLDGQPHPFAQITAAGLPTAYADPLTGQFEVDAVDMNRAASADIAAAGCYGVRLDTLKPEVGEVALALRDDTQVVTQSGTRLYLPAASRVTRAGDTYTLEQGVLWATTSSDAAAVVTVRVGDYVLRGKAAFAVEKLPNALPRLYVSQGEVEAVYQDSRIPVAAGQTLALIGGRTPAALAPGAGALLRSAGGSAARFELPSSSAQQLESSIKHLVVVVAQVIMALAMGISLLALPVTALAGVVLYYRRTGQ